MVISLHYFYHGYRDTASQEQEGLCHMYREACSQDYHCDYTKIQLILWLDVCSSWNEMPVTFLGYYTTTCYILVMPFYWGLPL